LHSDQITFVAADSRRHVTGRDCSSDWYAGEGKREWLSSAECDLLPNRVAKDRKAARLHADQRGTAAKLLLEETQSAATLRSAAHDGPKYFLQDYNQVLLADAYGGYDGVVAGNAIVRAGCWAHLRRKVIEAGKAAPGIAREVIALVRAHYAVERQGCNASVEDRLRLRQEQSAPVLAELREKLFDWKEQLLPKHPMAEAIQYVLGHREELNVFVADGAVAIDNNVSEREMKLFLHRTVFQPHPGAKAHSIFNCELKLSRPAVSLIQAVRGSRRPGCRNDFPRTSKSSRSTSREKLCFTAEREMTTLQQWRNSVTIPSAPSNTPLLTRTEVPTLTFACGCKEHPFAKAKRILSSSSPLTIAVFESPSRRITPGTESTGILA
jgi:hypothetical protein